MITTASFALAVSRFRCAVWPLTRRWSILAPLAKPYFDAQRQFMVLPSMLVENAKPAIRALLRGG